MVESRASSWGVDPLDSPEESSGLKRGLDNFWQSGKFAAGSPIIPGFKPKGCEMKFTKLVLISLFVGLAACSKSDDKKSPKTEIPENVTMGGPSGKALTLEEKAALKGDFKNAKLTSAVELSYLPRKESQEEYRKRMDRLAKLNPEQKELVRAIQASCAFNQPEEVSENASDIKVGSQNRWRKTSSIYGATCPVRSTNNSRTLTTITELKINNQKFESLAGNIEGSMEFDGAIIDPVWSSKVNMNALNVKGGFTGGVTYTGGTMKVYLRGALTGYYQLASGARVPVRVELETLQKEENGQKSEQSILAYNMDRAGGAVQLYESKIVRAGQTTVQYFLNGQQISEQEREEIFDSAFNMNDMSMSNK